MGSVWAFIRKSNNQRLLSWLGGGVVAAVGIWAVVTYIWPAHNKPEAVCGAVNFSLCHPLIFISQMLQSISNWYPPVGVWIGVLAVWSVFLPFLWEKLSRLGRAISILGVFALLLLELRSIYLERSEHEKEFSKTLEGMKQLLYESTGDGSYIYFAMLSYPFLSSTPDNPEGFEVVMLVSPHFVGKYPIHDVVVSPVCDHGGWLPDVTYGTLYPDNGVERKGVERKSVTLRFSPPNSVNEEVCEIEITGSNGYYIQKVVFIRIQNGWTWGSVVTKYGQKTFMEQFSGTGFPTDYKWEDLQ
jgi:hypothetical protein